jgi:quinolinate synthase
MQTQALAYTSEVAKATDAIYEKLEHHYSREYWESLAPYIYEINALKRQKNAVILAHNYMTPDIFHGVGDIMGDSLKLAQVAATTTADMIIQCGVHFMAETSKILSPEKKVIIPDLLAGCSLAESITGEDLRKLKAQYPGIPVVSYVNTTADVKAETDVCCTSSNALKIVNALGAQGHDTIIMTPDKFLAQNVAAQTNVKIIIWDGTCMVHERFSGEDVKALRRQHGEVVVIAHPECPPDVLKESDFSGSTADMDNYIKKEQPKRAILMTECSMGHNIAANNPATEMVGMCQMCPHMKRITLPKILHALQTEGPEVIIDPAIAERARLPIERMLELS